MTPLVSLSLNQALLTATSLGGLTPHNVTVSALYLYPLGSLHPRPSSCSQVPLHLPMDQMEWRTTAGEQLMGTEAHRTDKCAHEDRAATDTGN